jgi:hypothetical protein
MRFAAQAIDTLRSLPAAGLSRPAPATQGLADASAAINPFATEHQNRSIG